MLTRLIVLALTSLALGLLPTSTNAEVHGGPFVPGIGTWTLIPGGDFEDPSLPGFALLQSVFASATITGEPSAAYMGTNGAKLEATSSWSGPGVALSLQTFPVLPPGEEWVFSAFVRTPKKNRGFVYIDRWDAQGDINSYTSRSSTNWQFVCHRFRSNGAQIGARLVLDGSVDVGDYAYIDQLALTPASVFRPPQVQVFDGSEKAPAIRISMVCGEVNVHFLGKLQVASEIEGPYADIPGAVTPYVPAHESVSRQFFRAGPGSPEL